ncbi:MAG TPA: glycosyltransferase [Phycisphaerae bacterium]|nr:glycosyltransferase [Phycisphaerae bacterium]
MPLRVQFIHDWLTGLRGGEKVLLELVRLFPNSSIATLLHVPAVTHPDLDSRVNAVSFLQNLPGVKNAKSGGAYRNYLPLFPRAIRSLRLDPHADLYFSVSHAVAKGIRVPPGKPHICYCNTPMRYIWGMEHQYLSPWSPKRLALAAVKPYLRRFDRRNDQVTRFIGNSQTVADRIRRFYNLPADVVYPGIDESFYTPPPPSSPRAGYLVVSALVGYKRIDLAIAALRQLPDRPLTIIGAGPEEPKLRALAAGAPHIRFLGRAPDQTVRDAYRSANAFLFPGEEDFGLTPVEAQACGTPILAYRAGGATETVLENHTGLFFDAQSPNALRNAVLQFEASREKFSPHACRQNALRFTWDQFRRAIRDIVTHVLQEPSYAPAAAGPKMHDDPSSSQGDRP